MITKQTRSKTRRVLGAGLAALGLLTTIGVGAEAATESRSRSSVVPVDPVRILDTRQGLGGVTGPVGPNQTITIDVAGTAPVPPDATGVILNITASEATAASYVSAWPTGTPQPNSSVLNFTAGEDIANMVTATLGADGGLHLFNSAGSVHLVADVAGYLLAGDAQGTPGPAGPQGPQGPAGPAATSLSANPKVGEIVQIQAHGLTFRFNCATSTVAQLAIEAASEFRFAATIVLMTPTPQTWAGIATNATFQPFLESPVISVSGTMRIAPSGPDLAIDITLEAEPSGCTALGHVIPLQPPS